MSGGLIVRPGDVLVVGVSADTTADTAKHIRSHLMEEIPSLNDVIVMAGVTAEFVYRAVV